MNSFDNAHKLLRNSVKKYLSNSNVHSPVILLNKDLIKYNYSFLLKSILSNNLKIYYSLKANNNSDVIDTLKKLDSCFEISSDGDLQIAIKNKITPEKIIYSNPVKIPEHIANAFKYGIKTFAFDTESELKKISINAPKANVFLRIDVGNKGAEWKLKKKFGASVIEASELLICAKNYKLNPTGISFHVGWNNKNPNAWINALRNCEEILKELRKK